MNTSSESKESIRHQNLIPRRNAKREDGPGFGKMDNANICPPRPILLPNVRLEEVVGNGLTANVNLSPDLFPIPLQSPCRDLSPIPLRSPSHSTQFQIPYLSARAFLAATGSMVNASAQALERAAVLEAIIQDPMRPAIRAPRPEMLSIAFEQCR